MGNECCCSWCQRLFRLLSPSSTRSTRRGNIVTACRGSECLPKPPELTIYGENYSSSVLAIVHVDYCLDDNGDEHRTSRYDLMNREQKEARLVVRRGQPFVLDLHLSRNYDPAIDGVSIVFTLEGVKKPQYGQGTLVASAVLHPGEVSDGAWQTVVQAFAENSLRIKVTPAADAIIGKWNIEIDTKRRDSEGAVSFTVDTPFYLILNPWCRDDVVYLENEEQRQEYVMADSGLIWRGTCNRMRSSVWKFAQFERDILDCALYIMAEVGKVRLSARNDPVVISRVLSAAVNSADDYGVVMGNWSEDFGGGTPPSRWLGSQKILQEYYETRKPVKYGQCWVFAGVLATVCRTIGLPCRVVTNYSSAHDTQSSLTVDYFVDDNGKVMEELNSDSIWNFHVWNEVWMKRLDLTADCHGWQVIDSTPQELSENAYRLGPASVAAIKRAEVHKPYDNGFVFAEVNADKVFWRYNGPSQPLKLVAKDTDGVGQNISTKAVGSWEREDITHMYKYSEKSEDERDAMLKALRQSESLFSRYYLNEEFNDILFNFELRDDIIIGQPFSVVLTISNESRLETHKVSVILRVETVTYTGRTGDSVKRSENDRYVKPGSKDEVRLEVSWEEYGSKLLDQSAFNISCLATVKDTDYEYFAQDDFRVRKPDIKIKLDSQPMLGELFEATASFVNPLPMALKRGRFLVDGPGLKEQLKLKLTQDVEVGAEALCRFSMTPEVAGRATIAVKFYSKELDDVDGFIYFFVKHGSY
ncbi:PREDICTED: annulin isoform X2 [Ceratosolen solmsi marchali]|uniref:protein-glutamine gamma-glutamyltransferase n=1 Tax=Ceratosolen solmsi marchali TaxID=326594 RepID=A0AAJ7E2X3_9HYME|nr:PREDICTED: annulin isoform X2 [Ceratosolen solmsi marchali]